MKHAHTDVDHKRCPSCKLEKLLKEFSKAKKSKDGRQGWCKLCVKENSKDWRNKPKQRVLETKINAIKFKFGCILCQYEFPPACLAFHHLDPSQKYMEIARMLSRRKDWDLIMAEMDKCICICGNCHGKVHAYALFVLPEAE